VSNDDANAAHGQKLILLTGATGYVGGRLLHELERRGARVRCLARKPEYARARAASATEVVGGDILDADSLERAMAGVDTAYYLVHSMGSGGAFARADREGARNFGAAARRAGVRRIIYLGGLGDSAANLSEHLRSRHEVGDLLRESGVAVVEFRASIVIGSGSLSFEMVRALAERLPVMITPRWLSVAAQPISIGEVIAYLVAALDHEFEGNRIFEIGGASVVSYGDILREYARQRGLRCFMIRVPVLTPRLSSLWLGLVTPLYARVGRSLIDSISHPHPPDPVGRGDRRRAAQRGQRICPDPMVGCDLGRGAGARLRWQALRQPAGRFPRDQSQSARGRLVRAHWPHWGRDRMVLGRLAVDCPGVARPVDRRSRDAPRAPRPLDDRSGRHDRLLAG
jgi:uncharacterized protein YbjT (DUF2867 family)